MSQSFLAFQLFFCCAARARGTNTNTYLKELRVGFKGHINIFIKVCTFMAYVDDDDKHNGEREGEMCGVLG